MLEDFAQSGVDILAGFWDTGLEVAPRWDPGETKAEFIEEMIAYCDEVFEEFEEFESVGIDVDDTLYRYVELNRFMDVREGYPDYPRFNFGLIQYNLNQVADEYATTSRIYRSLNA